MSTRTTTMYSIRPIVTLPAIFLHTDTMYKMRNIVEDKCDDRRRHDANIDAKMPDDVVTEQVIRLLQKPLLCYTTLEVRQEKILNQLAELKEQVSTLCLFLKQSNQMVLVKDCTPVQKPVNVKLIVHVDPRRPPYSILALQRLWKDTDIRMTSYIHSTINDEPMPILFPSTHKINAKNTIHLSLIWKKVDDMKIITSTNNYPIYGEVNFLRYLSRLIETYNYENKCAQPHVLDFILDLIYYLHGIHCEEKWLSFLVDKFEEWSGKDGFNIADIAVWSLIKQFSPPITSQAFKQWYELCENTFINKTLIHC